MGEQEPKWLHYNQLRQPGLFPECGSCLYAQNNVSSTNEGQHSIQNGAVDCKPDPSTERADMTVTLERVKLEQRYVVERDTTGNVVREGWDPHSYVKDIGSITRIYPHTPCLGQSQKNWRDSQVQTSL